jgi:hypothetical protein
VGGYGEAAGEEQDRDGTWWNARPAMWGERNWQGGHEGSSWSGGDWSAGAWQEDDATTSSIQVLMPEELIDTFCKIGQMSHADAKSLIHNEFSGRLPEPHGWSFNGKVRFFALTFNFCKAQGPNINFPKYSIILQRIPSYSTPR